MARVQADPITAALAHPTRRNLYSTLCETDEMSTVQLQSSVSVDRYNLYHHLKKLASLGLVENHRDAGRARWWRAASRVDLPGIITAVKPIRSSVRTGPEPGKIGALLESDNGVHIISLEGSRDKVGAKLLFEQLADDLGIEVDIPWNFVPGTIALIEEDR
ncbi:MAG: helix-turn-helix domain-containing protein [Candidatus Poseidoniaceae archaeon]|jgi:DNA-binding transcriptional ArsR family regulator|nr:helix-turn-helix domain-containing protein [Candidatus Poseidoniaceae archaeon]